MMGTQQKDKHGTTLWELLNYVIGTQQKDKHGTTL